MTPSVGISKTDGNLGAASNTERILAIIAPASAGALDTPTSLTNKNDVTDEFTSGMLVEAASYVIARGVPVVLVRSDPTTPGDYGAIDETGVTGTATVAEGATEPDSDFDVIVEILTGGALGTAGIVFRYSHDNGVNWSQPTALGTSLTLTTERGVSFTLAAAASTLVAGDRWTVTTTGPRLASADLTTSLAALKDSSLEWLRVLVLGVEADATIIAQLESWAESFHAEGKYPEVITNTRYRDVAGAETRAEYQDAMAAIAAAVQTTETSPAVDQCEMVSSVNGWRLRMPAALSYAARTMIIDDSQDAAAVADGALPDVFLTTPDGERNYHDEFRFPGLDALGFTTLRTFGGRPVRPGTYVNNPRLLSGPGSDFRYFQLSAILNRAIEKTYRLLEPRLSQGVLVDESTGRIREDVAQSIEDATSADLRTEFSDPGRCSAIQARLSRTDNILVTDTITFSVELVPLAYLKKFVGKAGLVRTLAITPTT